MFGVGRSLRTHDRDFEIVYAHEELDQRLASADYVVISAPITKQTHHMFSKEQFENMRSSAFLINVGRGAIVDESALIDALSSAQISDAAPFPPLSNRQLCTSAPSARS